jgi:flagellar export protein FliJ
MGPFRFRAARALEVRHRQEDAAAAALARNEAALVLARRAWTAARARFDDANRTLVRVGRAGIDAETWLWHRNWIAQLSGKVDNCGQQIVRTTALVNEARQAWFEARQRRRMLDRLRERAWQRHRLAEQREEAKAMDELARARFTTPPVGGERSLE